MPAPFRLSATACALALTALSATPAFADDPDAICTDRPGKGSAPCAAPAGHFQLESDLFNGTFDRQGGVTTDTWLVTNPTLKYGVAKGFDVEAQIAPYEVVRTHDKFGGGDTVGGIGDLFLRAKAELPLPGDAVKAALFPFIMAPTARHEIGAGGWQGGVLLPVQVKLSDKWQLALTPELDATKDQGGGGHHLTHIEVVGLSRQLPANVTLTAELWGQWDYDPGGEAHQASFDLAAAWQVTKTLQWDVGLNLGLNHDTPGAQVYTGVSRRF